MSRLSLIRVAVILLFAARVQAQDPAKFTKAFITVTNKGDFDLSLSFTLHLAAPVPNVSGSLSNLAASSAQKVSSDVAPFHVERIVKPRQQTTFTIPKGDYTVEAVTAPQHGQAIIRQKRDPSNASQNYIENNEIWTFELDKGESTSRENPMSHTWKKHIWPVRQPKAADTTALPVISPAPSPPAPPQNLRIKIPTSP